MTKKIKVGLIGFGLSGRVFHLPLIRSNQSFQLVAASTRSPKQLLDLCPEVAILKPEAILEHEHLDLVIITSPNDTHAEYCERALNAGKHVLVERPFTVLQAEALHLCQLAKKKNKVLSVFHNRRFDANHLTLKAVLRSGALGQVTFYESNFDRHRPGIGLKWKEGSGAGAGVLFDLGSHLIDQMLDLFGMPSAVIATLALQRQDAQSVDFFSLLFTYKSNTIVQLRSSSFAAANSHRTLVYGAGATLVVTGLDPQEAQLASGMLPGQGDFGLGGVGAKITGLFGKLSDLPVCKGRYDDFYAALAQSILTNSEAPGSAEEAAKVVQLIEASMLSSLERRTVFL